MSEHPDAWDSCARPRSGTLRLRAHSMSEKTVLLAPRAKSSGCRLGSNRDWRRTSGVYYSKLTRGVICAAGFRMGTSVTCPWPRSSRSERECGTRRAPYGRALEINHIVSLELGGCNRSPTCFRRRVRASAVETVVRRIASPAKCRSTGTAPATRSRCRMPVDCSSSVDFLRSLGWHPLHRSSRDGFVNVLKRAA
jgi:hypothetical protein